MHVKSFIWGGVAALVLVAAFFFYTQFRQAPNSFDVGGVAVIKEIRKLNRWETASFTIEKIISKGEEKKDITTLLFGDKILLIASGQVVAGFDFEKVDEKNMSLFGKHIELRLNPPVILYTRLDNARTRVYDRTTGIFSKGDKNLEAEARDTAEKEILSAACAGNILKNAGENGKRQLTSLLTALGFSKISISFTSQPVCQ